MSAAQIMCMPVSLCPVESEEDYYPRERVPTLLPGQNDGTTPWEEFLHRFESCAKADYWSEKTMAIQLKFCIVGTAGAVIHRNPPSSHLDYRGDGVMPWPRVYQT